MKLRLGILLASAVLHLVTLEAHRAASLSGKWSVVAEAAEVESADGSQRWTLVAIAGTLQLEQKDSAVTGSWQGRLPAPWALTGKVDGQTFELQTEDRDMPVETDGQRSTVRRHWIFKGTIDGDALSGAMFLAGGATTTPSQPFTATRVR